MKLTFLAIELTEPRSMFGPKLNPAKIRRIRILIANTPTKQSPEYLIKTRFCVAQTIRKAVHV